MPEIGPILVLTDQPIIAALIGLQLEIIGRQPVFAQADETPTDAVQRLRPLAVVLVDVTLEAAHSDLLFATTARRGVGVVVFGPDHHARRIADIAGTRGFPWFTLPPDLSDLGLCLDSALGRTDSRSGGGERRAEPQSVLTPDGVHILRDGRGARWMVYDRRADTDRREAGAAAAVDRVFVSDGGEARHCLLASAEEGAATAAALQNQLERAVRGA